MQLPNAWRGKNRPCTAAEEVSFHSDLLDIAVDSGVPAPVDSGHPAALTWGRVDLTVLAAALRSGATAAEVVSVAPGVNVWALLGAYSAVERARVTAVAAWHRVVDLKVPVSEEDLEAAAVLIPTAARVISEARQFSTQAFLEVRSQQRLYIVSVWSSVDRVFSELAAVDVNDDHGTVALARKLYYPESDCLYVDAHFLPRRVGELSPHRVSTLCAYSGLLDIEDHNSSSTAVDRDIHIELHGKRKTSQPKTK